MTPTVSAALHVAPLRWWHLRDVAAAEAEAFGADAWSPTQWWEELAADDRLHLALLGADDAVHGYAAVALSRPDAMLLTMAVLPSGRGRGAGHRLLRAVLAGCAERRVDALHLEVREDNAAARRLYAAAGAVVIGRRRGYYDGGRVDGLSATVPVPR